MSNRRTPIAPFHQVKAGFYEAWQLSDKAVTVWREGEGDHAGRWFFASNRALSDASEPYRTMREAMDAAVITASEAPAPTFTVGQPVTCSLTTNEGFVWEITKIFTEGNTGKTVYNLEGKRNGRKVLRSAYADSLTAV